MSNSIIYPNNCHEPAFCESRIEPGLGSQTQVWCWLGRLFRPEMTARLPPPPSAAGACATPSGGLRLRVTWETDMQRRRWGEWGARVGEAAARKRRAGEGDRDECTFAK